MKIRPAGGEKKVCSEVEIQNYAKIMRLYAMCDVM